MKAFDKVFCVITVGFITAVVIFILFWWGAYLLGWDVPAWAIAGAVVGVGLGVVTAYFALRDFYRLHPVLLIIIHLAYSFGIFSFFMGVPVFNILPGILAGIYMGRKSNLQGEDSVCFNKRLLIANIYSSAVLLVACVGSAYLALTDISVPINIQDMFGINVTTPVLWGIIIGGGVLLLALQWGLAALFARLAYRRKGKAPAAVPGSKNRV